MTETRTPLNRARVLEAAVALADEAGIDALSMRRLARELGVEAMSLYNHVASKDDLLDGLVDAVTAEIELPDDATDWKDAIRRHLVSARDVYVRHNWAANLAMARQSGGVSRMRLSDWQLRTLREAGFSRDAIYHAFHILEAYLLGFNALHLSVASFSRDELRGKADEFLGRFGGDEYPDMVEHIRLHFEENVEGNGFELGLDLLLDGLERLRDRP